MSSSLQREPLSGQIHQGKKIVGSICLPEEDVQEFIEQFNHCYGPMRLKISPPAFIPMLAPSMLLPVGAGHRRPLREPPHPATPATTPPNTGGN